MLLSQCQAGMNGGVVALGKRLWGKHRRSRGDMGHLSTTSLLSTLFSCAPPFTGGGEPSTLGGSPSAAARLWSEGPSSAVSRSA